MFTHTLGGRGGHGSFTGRYIQKNGVTHIKGKGKKRDLNKWQEDRDEGSRRSGEVHETCFKGKWRK